MNFTTSLRLILASACAVAVAVSIGCAPSPVSTHPLSDDSNSTIDRSLLGEWEVVEQDETPPGRLSLRIDAKHASRFELEMTDADTESHKAMAYTTRVFDQNFLSMPCDGKNPHKGWVIIQYEVSDEAIAARLMDGDYIVRSIEANKLKGIVERHAEPPNALEETQQTPEISKVVITAKPAELREFLGNHSAAVFHSGEPIIFRRLPGTR